MPFIPDNPANQALFNQYMNAWSNMFSGPLDAMFEAKKRDQEQKMQMFLTLLKADPEAAKDVMAQPGFLEAINKPEPMVQPRGTRKAERTAKKQAAAGQAVYSIPQQVNKPVNATEIMQKALATRKPPALEPQHVQAAGKYVIDVLEKAKLVPGIQIDPAAYQRVQQLRASGQIESPADWGVTPEQFSAILSTVQDTPDKIRTELFHERVEEYASKNGLKSIDLVPPEAKINILAELEYRPDLEMQQELLDLRLGYIKTQSQLLAQEVIIAQARADAAALGKPIEQKELDSIQVRVDENSATLKILPRLKSLVEQMAAGDTKSTYQAMILLNGLPDAARKIAIRASVNLVMMASRKGPQAAQDSLILFNTLVEEAMQSITTIISNDQRTLKSGRQPLPPIETGVEEEEGVGTAAEPAANPVLRQLQEELGLVEPGTEE